jgi:multiple sugar transport system ATP-binding protein
MVFQHYALYPHMTARENMAFGLRNARVASDEIERRIGDAARVLEIEPLLDRRPAEMSGGQRQRIAIGRALVKEPRLFLFDEPLSNLDAALRLRTRVELAQLKRRVDAGVIMVTHDQAEAMTLADRIVVINDRRIQQVGAPMDVYNRPANTFVAQFVGSPDMMLLPARLNGAGEYASATLADGTVVNTRVARSKLKDNEEIRIGLRPEAVRVGDGEVRARVELVERLGDRTLVYGRLAGGQAITAEDQGNSRVAIGDDVGLRIDGAAAHIFGPDGTGYHRSDA